MESDAHSGEAAGAADPDGGAVGRWDAPAPRRGPVQSAGERLGALREHLARGDAGADSERELTDARDEALESVDTGEHRVELRDLPADVAERISYESAAPRAVKSKRLPPEAREAFAAIWDDLIGDVYDELKTARRRDAFSKATLNRVLERVGGRIARGQRLLIVTGVHVPVPAGDWSHVSSAVGGSALAAGAAEVAAYGSFGAAAAVAVGAAIMGELLETYLASSARTRAYERAGRSPDAQMIADDLAASLGHDVTSRRAARESAQATLRWLGRHAIERTGSRFMRGIVPVAGVALAGGLTWRDMRRVLSVEMRPPGTDELARLADGADPADSASPEMIEGFIDADWR